MARNVGNKEDKAVVAAVAFHTTTSHRGQEARGGRKRQEEAIGMVLSCAGQKVPKIVIPGTKPTLS